MKDVAATIYIQPGKAGQLIVDLPYSPQRIEKIRSIPGRRWHHKEKFWSVPDTPDMRDRLSALFAGDEVRIASQSHEAKPPRPDQTAGLNQLLQRVRNTMRAKHLSSRTEEAYTGWIRRFARRMEAPLENLGEAEISRFLSDLALAGRVSASTQNQAMNALMFLYHQVLGREVAALEGIVGPRGLDDFRLSSPRERSGPFSRRWEARPG